MIIVRLNGGLGNQMFQYAHGRSFVKNNNQEMMLDVSWYETKNIPINDTVRAYGLSNFNISGKIATKNDLQKFNTKSPFYKKVMRKIRVTFFPELLSTEYDIVLKSKDGKNFYLSGFWQRESLFKDVEEIIRKEFTLKEGFGEKAQEMAGLIGPNSVSLHMRNTDYLIPVNKSLFAHCGPEYYRKAVDLIAQKFPNPHFFVFSDDIEIAKRELKIDYPVTFVSNPAIKDYEEMILMSRCANNIIANSSFSWWAAWLNQNPQKIVVAPEHWYNNLSSNRKEITPNSWLKI